MKILGIETSCDETGVCLIETKETKEGVILTILGNQLYSQVEKHKEFGGVFPMLAKREHAKNLVPLLEACLKESNLWTPFHTLDKAGWHSDDKVIEEKIKEILFREGELFNELITLLKTIKKPDIEAIAVTNGPGLEPALWVGVVFAKALNQAWNIPLIPTNHMEGHIFAATLQKLETETSNPESKQNSKSYILNPIKHPAVALLISGGHTQLVLIKDNLNYEIIGNTKDDAVGEAYDKVARMMNLPYPGGKIISDLATKEQAEFPNKKTTYPLPRPMIRSGDLNFSFSGLKTAVLYTLKKIPVITDEIKQEIALEFERAVLEVLTSKVSQAIEEYNPQTLIIGGGVSANSKIRTSLEKICQKYNITFLVPEVSASTDNALMIAVAGFVNILAGKIANTDFKANGNLSL